MDDILWTIFGWFGCILETITSMNGVLCAIYGLRSMYHLWNALYVPSMDGCVVYWCVGNLAMSEYNSKLQIGDIFPAQGPGPEG